MEVLTLDQVRPFFNEFEDATLNPTLNVNIQAWARSATHLHLAVMHEPFLNYVYVGKKTIESRFSSRLMAPYQQIADGDVVLLKKASGLVCGLFLVGKCQFFELNNTTWPQVKAQEKAICANEAFWFEKADCKYASLMEIKEVICIPPMHIKKRDQRPWVVL